MPYLFSWSFRDGRAIFYELTVLCSYSTIVQCARRWLVTSLLVNQLTWFCLPGLYQGDQNAVWKAFLVKVTSSKFIFETAVATAKIVFSNSKLDLANFSEICFFRRHSGHPGMYVHNNINSYLVIRLVAYCCSITFSSVVRTRGLLRVKKRLRRK